MPARSQAQQRLMAAAEHGATFPMAEKVRASMTHSQMHDFAATKRSTLPAHVASAPHPHRNLGNFLHPPKHKIAAKMTAFRAKGAFKSAPSGKVPGPSSYGAGVD